MTLATLRVNEQPMTIELKTFQKNTLAVLARYLEQARLTDDPQQAFMAVARDPYGRVPLYRRVPGLEGVPYVCLRLPTGGGKTIVAAHAIRTAARSYIEKEFPVVLWLVPTNTIRLQTADALKNTAHSYRQALDDAFEGRVAVFDIADIDNLRPADLADRVCVIVGTIQTLRVEKTEGRDVYAHKEALESHFTRLASHVTLSESASQGVSRRDTSEGSGSRDASAHTTGLSMTPQALRPDLERFADGPNAGQVKYSFANLLSIHRPLVIVDEAHNARTGLTFDVLKRVAPACIIELTATPDTDPRTGSNILHRVSASELKAEALIKLPIVLVEHPTGWQDAVRDALLTRARLAELAAREPDYIRPLLLIQAENRDKPANVEAVKKYLIEDEKIAAERIAIATGDQRELDGINLFDPACPIEVIITVQALKEGWDCSFAYVFCSTANISASRDVEQLLGRVLRMPYARRRQAPDLNKAYAHVASASFGQAARELEDSLVNRMGFEEIEAAGAIESPPPPAQAALFDDLPLFAQPAPPTVTLTVDRVPDLAGLTPQEQAAITVRQLAAGNVQVELRGDITAALADRLGSAVPEALRPVLREQVAQYQVSRGQAGQEPRRQHFAVPRLCVYVQGELELAERELFLDAAGWNLLDCGAELADFHFNDAAKTFEFDVDGNRVVYQFRGDQQLELPHVAGQWTVGGLVQWLDKELRQPDIRQEVLQRWLLDAVAYLMDRQRLDLPALARAKFILVRALGEQIRACRETAAQRGYQELLFGPQAAVETSYIYEFRYEPDIYPAPAGSLCRSGYKWQKHFYPVPGELEAKGEEFECAQTLDLFPAIKRWVRNLERQPDASFWLPTATDRFYPDFVAELADGRLLVVEYKGGLTAQTRDTDEKRLIGEKWEEKSAGRGLFLIAEKRDPLGRGVYEQLQAKIGGRKNL
jgi:type III restriction enzyme